jgi:hypothetical protein
VVCAGKTELQAPHYILNQNSTYCHCTLHHLCVIISITSLLTFLFFQNWMWIKREKQAWSVLADRGI